MTYMDIDRKKSNKLTTQALFKMIFYTLLMIFGVCLALSLVFDSAVIASISLAACVIVSAPTLHPTYRSLSAWSLIWLIVILGSGVRGLFLAVDYKALGSLRDYLLLHLGIEEILRPAILHILFLALLSISYSTTVRAEMPTGLMPGRRGHLRASPELRISPILIGGLAVLGFIALALYVQASGGIAGSLTGKRAVLDTYASTGAGYQAQGPLLLLNKCSLVALGLYSSQFRRYSVTPIRASLLILLTLNAIALPIYASSRTGVVYVFLVLVFLVSGPRGFKTFPVGKFVAFGVALTVVFLGLSAARSDYAKERTEGFSVSERLIDATVFLSGFRSLSCSKLMFFL